MDYNVYFNDTLATLAAIEYVINKYGHHHWFNSQLRMLLKNLYLISNTETFKPPLIIQAFIDENGQKVLNKISGYHYLINTMEKYDKLSHLPINYKLIKIYIYFIYIIITIIFIIIIYYFIKKNYINFSY